MPKTVNAEGFNVALSPSLIELHATAPSDIVVPLSLTNRGSGVLVLKPVFRLFRQSDKASGQVAYLNSTDISSLPDPLILAKTQITLENQPTTIISLGPQETLRPQLHITLPKSEPTTDYYFSVIFLTDSSTPNTTQPPAHADTYTNIAAGVATNVLLSIGQTQPPTVSIDDFSAPWYIESGPVEINLKVTNEGTQYVTPSGTIFIKNMFGQTVGKIDVPQTTILANSSRYLTNIQAVSAQLNPNLYPLTPKLIWYEKFLLGFYTVSINLSIAKGKQIYQRNLHFLAFPLHFLVLFLIVLALAILIVRRVRAKLSN